MSRCADQGATHHTGCDCHEARRNLQLQRLETLLNRTLPIMSLLVSHAAVLKAAKVHQSMLSEINELEAVILHALWIGKENENAKADSKPLDVG